jgi:hypothetical protein
VASFTDRLIGSAKLDIATYEEVEADTGATSQAMVVVLISSVAGGIGALGMGVTGIGGIVAGGIAALLSWVVWAFVTYFVGTRLLPEPQTHADTGQLMRTLGFAQSPGFARVLGGVPGVGPLILTVVSIWMFVAMVIAVRQALDYTSTWRAVGVCFVGWMIMMIPTLVILTLMQPAAQ